MIRVLIVDDQTIVRAGFAALLSAQPDIVVVAEAGDGREAVQLADRHRPDLVLMDIRLPGMDGIEATRKIITARRHSRCGIAGWPVTNSPSATDPSTALFAPTFAPAPMRM